MKADGIMRFRRKAFQMTYTAVVRNATSGSEKAIGVGIEGTVRETRRKVEVVM